MFIICCYTFCIEHIYLTYFLFIFAYSLYYSDKLPKWFCHSFPLKETLSTQLQRTRKYMKCSDVFAPWQKSKQTQMQHLSADACMNKGRLKSQWVTFPFTYTSWAHSLKCTSCTLMTHMITFIEVGILEMYIITYIVKIIPSSLFSYIKTQLRLFLADITVF